MDCIGYLIFNHYKHNLDKYTSFIRHGNVYSNASAHRHWNWAIQKQFQGNKLQYIIIIIRCMRYYAIRVGYGSPFKYISA